MAIDPRQFRQILGSFLTGVTVVTMNLPEGGVHGMTANAFSSVSMDPPLVLVCVKRNANLHDLLAEGAEAAISFLREDQAGVSTHFAGYAPDVGPEFEGPGPVPVVAGGIGWIQGVIRTLVAAGDHTVAIIEARAMGGGEGAPLAYLRGKYGRFVQNTS